MLEIAQASFEREVTETSREVPVLVDFWAPWCGPCRVLGPMLEKLERDYGGRFSLRKIDLVPNTHLSAPVGVGGILLLVAVLGGKTVKALVGAPPGFPLSAVIHKNIS